MSANLGGLSNDPPVGRGEPAGNPALRPRFTTLFRPHSARASAAPRARVGRSPAARVTLSTTTHAALLRLVASPTAAPTAVLPLGRLRRLLAHAEVRPESGISPCAVQLRSTVAILWLASDEVVRFTLCLPEEADLAAGRFSVLTPLGLSVLGREEGDVVALEDNPATQPIRLLRVARPDPLP